MWNISRSFGSAEPIMGPCFKGQKRDFSFNFPHVNIAPGKTFKNPNFVNNHYPSVHSQRNNLLYSRRTIHNNSMGINEDVKTTSVVENSSQNIEEPIKEILVDNNQTGHSRKRCKNRRNRRKKVQQKNSKQNNAKREISDMMEIDIDIEPEISMNNCDSTMTATIGISPTFLNLTDCFVDITNITNKQAKSDDDVFTLISVSPPIYNKSSPRERELSICESEDSFIVFDSGTDEELKFSEDSDDNEVDSEEDEETDSDIDEDFDSSCSVVPCKRVRFADKEELCEIHPMVQWSFAYRNARKGPWEEYARDRARFNKRIKDTEMVLAPIFDQNHRENIYRERFDGSIV